MCVSAERSWGRGGMLRRDCYCVCAPVKLHLLCTLLVHSKVYIHGPAIPYTKIAKTMCPALFFDFSISILYGFQQYSRGESASFHSVFYVDKLQRKRVHENARNQNCVKLSKPRKFAGLHWTLRISYSYFMVSLPVVRAILVLIFNPVDPMHNLS
jgi:hypothetical protein